MNRMVSTVVLAVSAAFPLQLNADTAVPETCRGAPRPVALMDCIQTEIELMRLISEHHALVQDIGTSSPKLEPPPQVPEGVEESALERVAWFDENLEIYAIIGTADDLIAYARLGGRVYRLRRGDAVRLARVIDVHERGIELSVAGTEISIGLSGRNTAPAISN